MPVGLLGLAEKGDLGVQCDRPSLEIFMNKATVAGKLILFPFTTNYVKATRWLTEGHP